MDESFSKNYPEAREKFLDAARTAGAVIDSYPLPERGPEDGMLAADIAWPGESNASRVMVTISGTHGVEGFFGSATQIEFLWLRGAYYWAFARGLGI
jgi:hypothetical protein